MTTSSLFSRATRVGPVTFEPVDVDRDAALLHDWVTHPRSVFWGMQSATVDDGPRGVRRDRCRPAPPRLARPGRRRTGVPRRDLRPRTQRARRRIYAVADGDIGMHVLVAPTDRPRRGLTSAVFARRDGVRPRRSRGTDGSSSSPTCATRRIAAQERRGRFPSRARRCSSPTRPPAQLLHPRAVRADDLIRARRPPAAHLTPETMAVAHRRLIAKAIAEFSHERILAPEPTAHGHQVRSADPLPVPALATRWSTGSSTRRRCARSTARPTGRAGVRRRAAGALGIPDAAAGTYLEEISRTLAGAAWKHLPRRLTPRRSCTPTSRRSRRR